MSFGGNGYIVPLSATFSSEVDGYPLARARDNKASMTTVPRHKTAMRRCGVSKPVSLALADGLIRRGLSVLDYGCGRGGDLQYLRSRRVRAMGWDPYFRPNGKLEPADVVNLSYVL